MRIPSSLAKPIGALITRYCIDNPVFVVGCSRSGTSVLLQALGQHPQIFAAPGEAPILTSIGGAVSQFEFAHNAEYYLQSLNVPKQYLFDNLRRIGFEVAAGPGYGIKNLVKRFLLDRELVMPRRWAAKTFPSRVVADSLTRLYPGARFVYIIRNGAEVVRSMTKYSGFQDREFEKHCEAWVRSMETYSYLENNPSAYFLRYERINSEPEKVFEELFRFLQLGMSPKVVAFVEHTVVHPLDKADRKVSDKNAEYGRRGAPEANWNDAEKQTFCRICAPMMGKYGYPVSFCSEHIGVEGVENE